MLYKETEYDIMQPESIAILQIELNQEMNTM